MNPETLRMVALALAFAGILCIWIGHDMLRRRRTAREHIENVITISQGLTNIVASGECGHVWHEDGHGFHLCIRTYEHTGPHMCGMCDTDGGVLR